MATKSLRVTFAACLLLVGAYALPAAAQGAAEGRAVRAICCNCLDGTQKTVSLNTRTAPWLVSGASGTAQPVSTNVGNAGWSPLAPAGWVGPPAGVGGSTYTYTLTIQVPRCTIGGQVALKGNFGADNSATLFLGTTQLATTSGGNLGFQAPNFGSFSTVLTPGTHTLRVVVNNPHGPTGMILQAAIITQCPKNLEANNTGMRIDGAEQALACACEPGAPEA